MHLKKFVLLFAYSNLNCFQNQSLMVCFFCGIYCKATHIKKKFLDKVDESDGRYGCMLYASTDEQSKKALFGPPMLIKEPDVSYFSIKFEIHTINNDLERFKQMFEYGCWTMATHFLTILCVKLEDDLRPRFTDMPVRNRFETAGAYHAVLRSWIDKWYPTIESLLTEQKRRYYSNAYRHK